MKWYEASSIEELKQIGNLKVVKMEINKDIKRITGRSKLEGFIKMGSSSWKGQYEKILSLKKIINNFNGSDINGYNRKEYLGQANDINFNYFKSEADKYIFCLLELSGEERMRQLKIYKSLYVNKEAAREWYMNIAKSIHPDICSCEKSVEAMAELTSIYNKMVKHE
ncbi:MULTISPECIES: hypothetical protein [unclassified Clostridium]|uniref:hypothetical protein n=1 Tax=Clostridium TaxID=1485 RepID=UPI001C8B5230|nr:MULTISPECIES: hypothetical protein [unclassified Clostridium]MBX9138341.1 hypothetical protein [Clostridium sp. K12(2020)]MBX9145057.1 hypothetical protein [Clostridium sp. K13]